MVQYISKVLFIFLIYLCEVSSLLPPKFQWKVLDYAWEGHQQKQKAITSRTYIAGNNMPTGIARWNEKLFITVPRWKPGVPSSLNYVLLTDPQNALLHPYPSWAEATLVGDNLASDCTVVSAFRMHVDKFDRLWVVDNGMMDMCTNATQVTPPSILVFDLNTDKLLSKFVISEDLLRNTSVLTSIVVEIVEFPDNNETSFCNVCLSYAYITDMGSNAIIVYDFNDYDAWRVENHYFHFDPHAGECFSGGIKFYLQDGVSSAALSSLKPDGTRDLYLMPTSSTKQFKMSTNLLKNKKCPEKEIFSGVEVVGDRGPKTQVSACDYDQKTNVLFFTQLSKNGLGCWNTETEFTQQNTPLIFSDCKLMEFPSDVKVDSENNVWILSNRQSRFLYGSLNASETNFRVLSAPSHMLVQSTSCATKRTGALSKIRQSFGF